MFAASDCLPCFLSSCAFIHDRPSMSVIRAGNFSLPAAAIVDVDARFKSTYVVSA
jgi:hypothetical protein